MELYKTEQVREANQQANTYFYLLFIPQLVWPEVLAEVGIIAVKKG
jgi:hypothetical protein